MTGPSRGDLGPTSAAGRCAAPGTADPRGGPATMRFVLAAVLILGMIIGRIRGLKHLGATEFDTCYSAIKRISPF